MCYLSAVMRLFFHSSIQSDDKIYDVLRRGCMDNFIHTIHLSVCKHMAWLTYDRINGLVQERR